MDVRFAPLTLTLVVALGVAQPTSPLAPSVTRTAGGLRERAAEHQAGRAGQAVQGPGAVQDPGSAQDPEAARAEALRVAAALGVVRDRRANPEAKAAAMDELLTLGVKGPQALADELESQVERLRRTHGKQEERLLGQIGKGAARVVAARLDRKALAEVDAQRRVVLGNAAQPALSKDTIHSSSDPAFARLEELLSVTPNQVFDADEKLFGDWVALLDGLELELALHARWDAAHAALAAHPDGARIAARMRAPERPARDLDALLAEAAWRAELAAPMSDADRATFVANRALAAAERAPAGPLDPEEVRGIEALNRRRVFLGLAAQRIDLRLCAACRTHSRDMVEHGFFAHESPVPGHETPWKRAEEAGTSASAENIAAGASAGPDTIMQWWYSPGHHKNMLGGGSRTGLGRHQNHWTQLFGG